MRKWESYKWSDKIEGSVKEENEKEINSKRNVNMNIVTQDLFWCVYKSVSFMTYDLSTYSM